MLQDIVDERWAFVRDAGEGRMVFDEESESSSWGGGRESGGGRVESFTFANCFWMELI